MIEYITSNQVSLFRDLSGFAPTPQNISNALIRTQQFGLIPNVVNEITMPTGSTEARLSLSHPQQNWRIDFSAERLNFHFLNQNENLCDRSQLIIDVCQALGYDTFTRYGVVSGGVLSAMPQTQLDVIHEHACSTQLPFLTGRNIFEWGVRHAIRERFAFALGEEEVNCVYNMNRGRFLINAFGRATDGERLIISIDVNTLPETKSERIRLNDISQFISFTYNKLTEFVREIEAINA